MEYYIHRSMGFVDDYFGEVGEPVKISMAHAALRKMAGYKVTAVPNGTSLTEVKVICAIKNGAHPKSYKVEKIRKEGECLTQS